MLHRACRLALAALLTLAAAPLASDASAARSRPTTIQTASSRTRTHARARRGRRPPPGGVYARCAVVVNPVTNRVLFEKNADRAAPIASITKLMTAMVFLEQKPDLTREVEVTREELYKGGHTQLCLLPSCRKALIL